MSQQNRRSLNFVSSLVSAFTLSLVTLLSPSASFSEGEADPYTEGVSAYRAGRLEDARKAFLKTEVSHPGHPDVLLNLGLIAEQEKKIGAALALWRKGLASNPTDTALNNAVDWLRPKLEKSEIAREIEPWEEFRQSYLLRLSPNDVTLASAFFLVAAGWLMLRWWGARSRALELETALPKWPLGGAILSLFFFAMFSTSIAMFIDRTDLRGTILIPKCEIRSAPDANATVLVDLYEGMEVIVHETRTVGTELWRRISYPGAITGWTLARDVFTSVDSSDRIWEQ